MLFARMSRTRVAAFIAFCLPLVAACSKEPAPSSAKSESAPSASTTASAASSASPTTGVVVNASASGSKGANDKPELNVSTEGNTVTVSPFDLSAKGARYDVDLRAGNVLVVELAERDTVSSEPWVSSRIDKALGAGKESVLKGCLGPATPCRLFTYATKGVSAGNHEIDFTLPGAKEKTMFTLVVHLK